MDKDENILVPSASLTTWRISALVVYCWRHEYHQRIVDGVACKVTGRCSGLDPCLGQWCRAPAYIQQKPCRDSLRDMFWSDANRGLFQGKEPEYLVRTASLQAPSGLGPCPDLAPYLGQWCRAPADIQQKPYRDSLRDMFWSDANRGLFQRKEPEYLVRIASLQVPFDRTRARSHKMRPRRLQGRFPSSRRLQTTLPNDSRTGVDRS